MNQVRLHLLVEGQTEENFVNQVLAPHLFGSDVFAGARMIQTSRRRGKVHKGGAVNFERFRADLGKWMKEDRKAQFTMMLDLYKLSDDFPSFAESRKIVNPVERARFIQEAIAKAFDDRRLHPYLQVHEFESLLFSNPAAFREEFPESRDLVNKLTQVREACGGPEYINDGPETSPAKQIEKLVKEEVGVNYVKTAHGAAIARAIGLAQMRASCPHFNEWISNLESLATAPQHPPPLSPINQ